MVILYVFYVFYVLRLMAVQELKAGGSQDQNIVSTTATQYPALVLRATRGLHHEEYQAS
jgi:hypothetical protein